MNTTKPKTKVLAVFGQKIETKVSTLRPRTFKPKTWLSLRPFMNTGPVYILVGEDSALQTARHR